MSTDVIPVMTGEWLHAQCWECVFAAKLRRPYPPGNANPRRCCSCGLLTTSGILTRAEPGSLPSCGQAHDDAGVWP